jgi:molybdopterin molybdotransferase
VLTSGSTAAGPADHVHAVLADLGGRLVVDGVAVRPGHPMLLAEVDGTPVVGLPGNPLAAVSALLTLLQPLLAGMRGSVPAGTRRRIEVALTGHPRDTRLVPLTGGRPSLHRGPAMLRGLVSADVMAVVPPGGLPAGAPVEALVLPWPAPAVAEPAGGPS